MINKYPDNLIVEDAWGTVPLLYALWGGAPREIIQFIVHCYKSLSPNYQFNWSAIIGDIGWGSCVKECNSSFP
jgi:hypothetical protein